MSSHCVKSLHLERGVSSRIITSVRLSVSPALVARLVWYMARNTQYFIVDGGGWGLVGGEKRF